MNAMHGASGLGKNSFAYVATEMHFDFLYLGNVSFVTITFF